MQQQNILKYRSGEEIKTGDRILFHGNPAEIGPVASVAFCDPKDAATAWYVQKYGGGVLILEPVVSGRTIVAADQLPECEDLEFVSRAGAK